ILSDVSVYTVRQLLDELDVAGREAKRGRLPLVADDRHRERPALARRTDHLIGRDGGSVEFDLPEFSCDTTDHAQRTLLDAWLMHGDDECRDALVPRYIRVGAGQQQTPVGDVGVTGPDLVSMDDVVVAVAGRLRSQRREVRTGARLRETLAPAFRAADHAGQESLLKFLAAVPAEPDHQVPQTRPGRGACARKLLVEDDVVYRRQLVA